jgi:hypothetical protein
MNMQPVKSNNIGEVGYDETTKTLAIRFKSGGLYHYSGVSPETHKSLMGAASVGSHFFATIKGKFDFTRIEEHK